MIKNSYTATIFFSAAALVLFGLLGWSFYHIAGEHRQSVEYLRQEGESAAEERAFQALRRIQTSAEEDLAAFESAVFSQDKLLPVIEPLENAGRTLGLKTEISSVEKTLPDAGPLGFLISIDSEGSWKGAFAFLQAVENLPYRVVFKEASLAKKKEGPWRAYFTIFMPAFE